MLDSNKNKDEILFKEEFDRWQSENEKFNVIYTLTREVPDTWQGEKGRIDAEFIKKHVGKDKIETADFFICGPPAMLNDIKKTLTDKLEIPQNRIKIEEFTGY